MSDFKRISVISVIFLMTILCATLSFAKTGTVNVDEVVVRDGPSTSTGIVMGIRGNTEVEILGEEEGFYKIKYNETTGYVRSDLLNVKEEVTQEEQESVEVNVEEENETTVEETTTEENTAEDPTDDVEINEEELSEFPKEYALTTNVNVYILPLYTSTIIATIENGNTITINKEVNNWSYITYGNITGWVRNFNLENSVEAPAEETVTEQETPAEVDNETQEQAADIEKGYVNVSSVNVRKEENTDCEILTSLTRNTEVKVVAVVGDWYKIQYGDITGYIMQQYISDTAIETTSRSEEERETAAIETKTGYISVKIANVRANASTSSKLITTLKQKDEVEVLGTEGEFTKVILEDGTTAYVATRLIVYSLDEIEEIPETKKEESTPVVVQPGNTSAQGIVDFANQFLGRAYVYGGTTPEGGFDCSGFTYYVFNQCGYNLSRSCSVQANSGVAVSKAELQPGDLVFFNNGSNGSIGHVGIYIGNGQFIHASNPTRGVVIDTINSGYYCTYYYSARRIG